MTSRRALAFIFCTVSLDVLALGIMIPVLPSIVLAFMGGDTAEAANVFGAFAAVWALMQFICSPFLGMLSDRFGRRPVILVSCLGMGLDYIFMALAPSLALLFVGRIISGITAATIGTALAYIADVTRPEERARSFGLIGMAFGLGFVLGPAIGGLLGGVEPRLPFWVSAAASLLNAAFGWFVLPESLPPERRMAFAWSRANPVGALRLLLSHRQLIGLAAVDFIVNLAHQVLPAVAVLYAGYRYGWDETAVGLALALVGLCSAVVQGLVIGPAVARLGTRWALLAGLLCGALGMTIYGLAPTGAWFLLGVPIMALWGVVGPAIQDLMTRRVGESEQGQLQGANSAARSIAALLGPPLFTMTFAHLIGWLPGAAFLLAAALLVMAAGLAWRIAAGADGSTTTSPAADPRQ
ncbi:TCR/Tet family MFS transporter [Reyranella sp.]|uniref:TCR/Tet family MFS transporter n=1 Tax=Reyranella sp. TaxID=1929291 RepID=UPI003BAC2DDE